MYGNYISNIVLRKGEHELEQIGNTLHYNSDHDRGNIHGITYRIGPGLSIRKKNDFVP